MKLGRIAILMIGVMIFIAAMSFGYLYKAMPNNKEVELLQKATQANNDEAAKMQHAKERVAKAIKMVNAKGAAWSAIVATRTPPTDVAHGGIDLAVNPWQLSVETPKFRDSIQRAVNAQVKRGGVTVLSSPVVPGIDPNLPVGQILPAFYNYPALKFPVVIFDFGTITVQGTYSQILENVRAYKSMPHYLAVTSGLRIDGTSPNLTGTYNLTVVGFIRGKKIAPDVNPLGEAVASLGGMGAGGGQNGPPGQTAGGRGGRGTGRPPAGSSPGGPPAGVIPGR